MILRPIILGIILALVYADKMIVKTFAIIIFIQPFQFFSKSKNTNKMQAWTQPIVVELPKRVKDKLQDSMTGELRVIAEDEQSKAAFFLNIRIDFGQNGMERTKMITVFSEVVVTNRTGQDVFMTQYENEHGKGQEELFFQGCRLKPFHWTAYAGRSASTIEHRKLCFRVGGSQMSPPIDISR